MRHSRHFRRRGSSHPHNRPSRQSARKRTSGKKTPRLDLWPLVPPPPVLYTNEVMSPPEWEGWEDEDRAEMREVLREMLGDGRLDPFLVILLFAE